MVISLSESPFSMKVGSNSGLSKRLSRAFILHFLMLKSPLELLPPRKLSTDIYENLRQKLLYSSNIRFSLQKITTNSKKKITVIRLITYVFRSSNGLELGSDDSLNGNSS